MKVTYSGPVRAGEKESLGQDPLQLPVDQGGHSTIERILMCQTANFTGSEAYTLYSATESDLTFKELDIAIPYKAEILRVDVLTIASPNGDQGEYWNIGVMLPDGTADVNFLWQAAAYGAVFGVLDPLNDPHTGRWTNVGTTQAGSISWPSGEGKDARLCVNLYDVGAEQDTATGVSWGTSASNLITTTPVAKTCAITDESITVTPASMTGIVKGQTVTGTGIPTGTTVATVSVSTITLSQAATATNGTAALSLGYRIGNGGIQVGVPVRDIDKSANAIPDGAVVTEITSVTTFKISKTPTIVEGSGGVIYGNASSGGMTLSVHYLQDRDATVST